MGYNTLHTLNIIGEGKEHLEDIIRENEDIFYGLQYNGEPTDAVKWYSHEDDMRQVSGQYPGLLFKLVGEGEDAGDMWVEYHRDGKMQRVDAKIIFEEFDESKLR